jgi:ABC-type multidrug transport system permease subunit
LLVLERCNIPLFALVYLLGAAFMSTLLLLVAVSRPFQWFAYLTWPFILLPLTTLSSLYYPFKAVEQLIPWFASIVRWFPTTSLVEGMRGSMIRADMYMPVPECIVRLVIYTIIAYGGLWLAMRKRFDMVEGR